MTRKGKFILAGVTAATFVLAAAGAIAARGDWQHSAARPSVAVPLMGMAGLGLGIGSPAAPPRRGDAGEMADHMLVRIEHKISRPDAQKGVRGLQIAARAAAQRSSRHARQDG